RVLGGSPSPNGGARMDSRFSDGHTGSIMHIFLNCLAARAGGGLTYLRNVVPNLSASPGVQTTVAAPAALQRELGDLPNVRWAEVAAKPGAAGRFCWEQSRLARLIRRS